MKKVKKFSLNLKRFVLLMILSSFFAVLLHELAHYLIVFGKIDVTLLWGYTKLLTPLDSGSFLFSAYIMAGPLTNLVLSLISYKLFLKSKVQKLKELFFTFTLSNIFARLTPYAYQIYFAFTKQQFLNDEFKFSTNLGINIWVIPVLFSIIFLYVLMQCFKPMEGSKYKKTAILILGYVIHWIVLYSISSIN